MLSGVTIATSVWLSWSINTLKIVFQIASNLRIRGNFFCIFTLKILYLYCRPLEGGKGVLIGRSAEIIPIEADAGNAAVAKSAIVRIY